MNLFDLIIKDLDTLRKEHEEAAIYAEKMTDAQMEYTDKICAIADSYGVERKHAFQAAISAILGCLLNGAYDKEATK